MARILAEIFLTCGAIWLACEVLNWLDRRARDRSLCQILGTDREGLKRISRGEKIPGDAR